MKREKEYTLVLVFILYIFSTTSLFSDTLKDAKKAYSGRQFQKAVKLFMEYTKTNPTDGEPYMYLGYIYESLREYNISIAYFRKSVELKLNPKQKTTVLLKLVIYFNYLQAWNYVVHYSNQYLALEPGNQEVEKILSRARGNRGSDQVSAVNIQIQDKDNKPISKPEKLKNPEVETVTKNKPEKQDKQLVSKDSNDDENELWRQTLKTIEKEDYGNAFSLISKLINLNPSNKNYLYKAGIIKFKQKEYLKAIDFFDSALKYTTDKDDTMNYYLYLNKGYALGSLEKYEQALDSLKKSYSYNKSFSPLIAIIKLKYDNGDFEDSLRYSNYIYNIDSENLDALMYRSISKLQLSQKKEGFKNLLSFSKKLKLKYPELTLIPEKYHIGINYLATYYSGRKKYKLSRKYLNVVQNTKNSLKSYKFTKAKNDFYLKNIENSVIELENLEQIPAANFLLSKCYLILNNINKAKELLVKATKLKDLYWSRALVDPVYKSVLQKNNDLSSFVINKGIPPKSPTSQEEPKKTVTSEVEPSSSDMK